MRFVAKFFRRWYLYLLPIIVLPALATMYGKQALTIYESSALIYINKPTAINGATTTFNQYLSPGQNGANAMNEALLSETFVVGVAKKTDLANLYDLRSQYGQDAVTVRIRGEVNIAASAVGENTLTLAVDDKSAHLAQQIAQALIDQFSIYFNQGQQNWDQTQIDFYQQQLKDAQSKVGQDQARITQYLQQHPSVLTNTQQTDPTYESMSQQLQTDQAQVTTLNGNLSNLQLDLEAAQNGLSDVFKTEDPPRVPLTSTMHLKKLVVYPAGGLAVALALIMLIVGVQTLTDRRVYSKGDLRTITENMELDIPTIEAVPVLRGLGKQHNPDDDPAESGISGVLVPVLTVLPQLGSGQMTHELRRAVGVMVEGEE